jgi:hypothetical protein
MPRATLPTKSRMPTISTNRIVMLSFFPPPTLTLSLPS